MSINVNMTFLYDLHYVWHELKIKIVHNKPSKKEAFPILKNGVINSFLSLKQV